MRSDNVRRRLTTLSLVATAALAMAAVAGICPAAAQTVPEGQSCGGLVCDLGIFGHKTTPSPAPAPAIAPSPGQTAAAPPVAAEPKAAKVRKPKRFAKAAAPSPAAIAAPTLPPVAAPAASPSRSTAPAVVSSPSDPVVSAAGKPAAATPPTRDEVYIRPNPYTSGLAAPTLIVPIGPAPPQP